MSRRAKLDLSAAKVLATRLPAEVSLPSTTYPQGSVVLSLLVVGRAVPWKVSIRRRGHGPATNPTLVAWKAKVRRAAELTMEGRPPHCGPYRLDVHFALSRRPSMPDLTNLVKAAEDAIQGIIIVNDRMGQECHAIRGIVEAGKDLMWLRVTSLGGLAR